MRVRRAGLDGNVKSRVEFMEDFLRTFADFGRLRVILVGLLWF